ncbi:hypothetical protein [Dactylosporangium sp. CS-033363]
MLGALGERRQALAFLERAPAIQQDIGDRDGEANTRWHLAGVHRAGEHPN